MWLCPLCKTSVSLHETPIRCINNHSFDKAKAGYVNLLPVQFKKSKMPGDDKAMVRARREFHQRNAYKPLKDRMCELIGAHLNPKIKERGHVNIYDAGCGEGSYLNAVVAGLKEKGLKDKSLKEHTLQNQRLSEQDSQAQPIEVTGAGSDISKIAVELAAKAYKQHTFVVASSFDLPLEANSQDVVLQVFAPGSNDEYQRILTPEHGLLITVDPAEDHLYEIKQRVYDAPEKHQLDVSDREGFSLVTRETLRFEISLLNNEHALSLVKMTPFYWKLPQDSITDMVNTLTTVTAHFHIQVWETCV
ncbi:MAG: putative RNA methyltransferase [Alteromonas sp.]|jgi:23S rRNA (guanine745-N1)-methyltransferase|uniref:putative RNA methyltransferase n=1 Tax=Alteromonas sp. TaxID=232 RepID=UPI0032D8D41C